MCSRKIPHTQSRKAVSACRHADDVDITNLIPGLFLMSWQVAMRDIEYYY